MELSSIFRGRFCCRALLSVSYSEHEIAAAQIEQSIDLDPKISDFAAIQVAHNDCVVIGRSRNIFLIPAQLTGHSGERGALSG